ncbi:MAG: carboxymuconolactone decarboxylase family protein [Minwuia sp.]|uniref:carboxymuconolactone decarboxylase family protein n=1 Tax=Minwuia sp. TaxID=2493630 RepID=UPI003A848117
MKTIDRIVEPVSLRDADPEQRAVLDDLRKQWSKVPMSFAFMAAQPDALKAFSAFSRSVIYDCPLDPKLREIVYLRTAMLAGCKLCVANHTAEARKEGASERQIAELDRAADSDAFTALEKDAIRYAEHVAGKPGRTPEDLLARLRDGLGNDGVIALTQVIGLANLFSRFNNALHTYDEADYA